MEDITFEPFPKLARYKREIIITEKIDGTNAQVIVTSDGRVGAASRNRLITPEDDNFGFASWVRDNEDELRKLGPGRHFGEWWGRGIQRGYGMEERRFSLFNTSRYQLSDLPQGVYLVPELYRGEDPHAVDRAMEDLTHLGSFAVESYGNPEGIVIYHTASRSTYKMTFEHDGGKWNADL